MASDITNSSLNLGPEEKRLYGQLFAQADTEGLGVVTGDVAVKFFERTRLDPTTLGEIWQIADTENRGLLTPAGFSIVLRLIGHCQSGQQPSLDLAKQPGPLPTFDGMGPPPQPSTPTSAARTSSPQLSGGPVRVPPLSPEKVSEYSMLFERAGAQNGLLGGEAAKTMFERARLPNEALGRIWNLSDMEQRGALNLTEFIIAMHLIFSMRSGTLRALPQTLPPGLYEAAARRGPSSGPPGPARQLTGQSMRTQSPLQRGQMRSPPMPPQGTEWLVTPQDKAKFDQIFATVDTSGTGYITGDQAVSFMSTSGLSDDSLASIWDLADITSDGSLSRDEFAVAMYLIRQERSKTSDRGNLPKVLPPMLVPPSMRQRNLPPQQPTAPAFDNAAFAPAQPKSASASEDLFGLDALSSEPQATQELQGSPGLSRSIQTPPQSFGSPQTTGVQPSTTGAALTQSPQTTGTTFKPFMPTSSFGQNLAQELPGRGGPSTGPATRGISRSATDDLLGDNDPEVSSKLTNETSELGNMSNQISTLRNQMQEVQGQRSTAENNIATSGTQKRELETRLSQFRTQYEEEVRQVKALEERLTASRNDTRKLQQELAMLEGTHSDLKTQHQQVATALEADQRENASLKERTRVLNDEVAQLRPQLEKMRSDARQQKGMVAINKKQVATVESEKDKIQGEMGDLEKSNAEAARSLTSSPEPIASTSRSIASPSQSTNNPFFRMTSQDSVDRQISPSIFAQDFGQQSKQSQPSQQSAFDSFFGPSQTQSQPSEPPPTTFRSATPPTGSRSIEDLATSPPTTESPMPIEPPAPPESRQITSSFLPLRTEGQLSESRSSSVKAMPPASRAGLSNAATPARSAESPDTSMDGEDTPSRSLEPEPEPSTGDSTAEAPTSTAAETSTEPFGPPLALKSSIPGSFPVDTPTTPTASSTTTGDREIPSSDPFASTQGASKPADFNAVFGSSENVSTTAAPAAAAFPDPSTTDAPRSTSEFPPIQELEADDSDSDSGSEQGFEDDFAPQSPPRQVNQESTAPTSTGTATADTLPVPKPSVNELESSGSSQLPTPTHQQSPPTYDQTVQSPTSEERNVNQFPAEYGNLVPSREFATSDERPVTPSATGQDTTSSFNPFMNGFSQPANKTTDAGADDFDSAFDDLTEAQPEDEAGHDSFLASRFEDTEFDPTFDSPAPSKTATYAETPPAATTRDTFSTFEPSMSTASKPSQPFAQDQQHDWDALFAGLDSSTTAPNGGGDPFELSPPGDAPTSTASAVQQENVTPVRPQPPGRALSTGTEHDDPILKRLTGMGFSRDAALNALEKYDYNLDKAADYLTSTT